MAVNIDLSGLNTSIKGVKSMEKAIDQIGQKVVELNNQQIFNQIDKKGKRFPRYSPGWVQERIKRKLTPHNKVDLTITGNMLRDFGIVSSGRGKVVIGFTAVDSKRKALSVLGHKRLFVGLNERSRRKLLRYVFEKFIK